MPDFSSAHDKLSVTGLGNAELLVANAPLLGHLG